MVYSTVNNDHIVQELFLALPTVAAQHGTTMPVYRLLKTIARQEIERLFSGKDEASQPFGPFGKIAFPYHRMGAIDSLDLFGLDELILFSFYWVNRGRYSRVADIGANIGLHSVIMSRCGFRVKAFEPDPEHFTLLQRNLDLNQCENVAATMAAVSKGDGTMDFVRVLGNTTGSHLVGSKESPYGDLERFPVEVHSITPLVEWADLVKIDAEGHEWQILSATDSSHWSQCDAIVEVGNAQNASNIYEWFRSLDVNLFAQKSGWSAVTKLDNMPTSYRDGSLFISSKGEMPWG